MQQQLLTLGGSTLFSLFFNVLVVIFCEQICNILKLQRIRPQTLDGSDVPKQNATWFHVFIICINVLIPSLCFGVWYTFMTSSEFWKFPSLGDFLISLLQIPFLLLVADAFYYPYHYGAHAIQKLKFIHNMHHEIIESEHLFWSYYAHPIDFLLGSIISMLPLYLCANGYLGLVHLSLEGLNGLFNHHGIIVSIPHVYDARFHDDHHRFFHVNYALNFKFFDVLFNTYRAPNAKGASLEEQTSEY